jgi:hypothetical protein
MEHPICCKGAGERVEMRVVEKDIYLARGDRMAMDRVALSDFPTTTAARTKTVTATAMSRGKSRSMTSKE